MSKNPEKFFDESKDQSMVKAEIVEKYFYTWARIILGALDRRRVNGGCPIAYVDLFAGPGRYRDGAASTPIRVLQRVVEDEHLSQRLITIFNDRNGGYTRNLEAQIANVRGIENLRYQPEVWNQEVGTGIERKFRTTLQGIPRLAFIDPWGYKGLSLGLIDGFLREWGCDCIFFFNYNRIRMGIPNDVVRSHMDSLFGRDIVEALRRRLQGLDRVRCETVVVDELIRSLQKFGHRFVLPFCFMNADGKRTSHHLILVSKEFKAYDVMKGIMAGYSSEEHQGVPTFTYIPAFDNSQMLLFDLNRPLDDLPDLLRKRFAGHTLNRDQIYETHSVGYPYLKKHYNHVLKMMEAEESIIVSRRKGGRKGTFAKETMITFRV